MALTAPILPFVGDVRVVPVGQISEQREALPWNTGTTTVTATTGAGSQTLTTTGPDVDIWTCTVPVDLFQEPGVVQLRWDHDQTGQFVETSLDVRAGRLPVYELTKSLTRNGSTTSSSNYPAWKTLRALGDALLELERECRQCLVPQRRTIQISGASSGRVISIDEPNVHRIVECSDSSVDLNLSTLDPDRGILTLASSVSAPLQLTIDHGETGPAPDVARAITLLASSRLVDGPADDRGFLVSGDGVSTRLLTAGVGRARFSIPDVEACYVRHRITPVG